MLRRKFFMAVAAAAVAGLLGSASARAGFTLTLSTSDAGGPGAFTISDGGANDTDGLANGAVTFNGVYNNLDIKSIASTANGTGSGNVVSGVITTSQNTISNDSGSTKTIRIVANNDQFTLPGSSGNLMDVSGLLSGFVFDQGGPNPNIAHTGNVLVTLYVQGIGTTTGTTNTVTIDTSSSNFSGNNVATQIANFFRGSNYTLASYADVTLTNHSDVTFNSNVTATATPAPATAILVLAGAPIFGVFGWMRRRKAVVA